MFALLVYQAGSNNSLTVGVPMADRGKERFRTRLAALLTSDRKKWSADQPPYLTDKGGIRSPALEHAVQFELDVWSL
jgi:hypothetical protein